MPRERLALPLPRGVIVVVVEARLPDRHHSRVAEQLLDPAAGRRAQLRGPVRVHSRRGEHSRAPRQGQAPLRRVHAVGHRHDGRDARRASPRQHHLAVGVEGRVREVAVGVHQSGERHGLRRRPPRYASAGGGVAALCAAGATRARTPRASLPGHRLSMYSSTGPAM